MGFEQVAFAIEQVGCLRQGNVSAVHLVAREVCSMCGKARLSQSFAGMA